LPQVETVEDIEQLLPWRNAPVSAETS